MPSAKRSKTTARKTSSTRRRTTGKSRGRPIHPATPRQTEILTFVRNYVHRNGFSPTYDEIADELGISKVTVFEHLTTLEKRGLLKRSKHKARSLELARHLRLPDERPSCLKLVGRIAAGTAIEAIEEPETLDLEQIFNAPQGTFVLEVQGDSMIDDQIADGDFVVCERRTTPNNGETVVALLEDGEATLKRFYRERNRIRLQPANPKYEPIYVTNARIQGIVIGVIRRL